MTHETDTAAVAVAVPVDTRSVLDIVRIGDAVSLKTALEQGRDVNTPDHNGMTPLHHAAARGARPCLRLLVASGRCNYLAQDSKGRHAAELAIEYARDYAVARLLGRKQLLQALAEGVPPSQLP